MIHSHFNSTFSYLASTAKTHFTGDKSEFIYTFGTVVLQLTCSLTERTWLFSTPHPHHFSAVLTARLWPFFSPSASRSLWCLLFLLFFISWMYFHLPTPGARPRGLDDLLSSHSESQYSSSEGELIALR